MNDFTTEKEENDMNDKKPEVSVTIITYGHEKYIRQCLDSVLTQETSFPFEVIVAEDASPDNTRQILLKYKEKYGDQLILILHDENLGPSANSASIRPFIKGKYVAIVEGDDYWTDKHKLQKQYDLLEKHPEYSAVCSDNMTVDPSGNIIANTNLDLQEDIIKTMKDWQNEPYSVHTCTIFRRNIFPNNDPRYIELRRKTPTMGDIISFSVLYDYGPIYVMKDVMAAHRIAGKSDSSSFTIRNKKDPLKYTKLFIQIFTNVEDYFDNKYDFSKRKCIKVALVKIGKITGYYQYAADEMRTITNTFSFGQRIYIDFLVLKELVNMVTRKIKKIWRKA